MRVSFAKLVSARRILVLCISHFESKYEFRDYLLQTFPVYNKLMTTYIPQEKQKNEFAIYN